MKIPIICACFALVFARHAAAQATVGPGAVKLGKVQIAAVKTPEFNLSSGPIKRSKPADWLEFEVEYETKAEEIDDLTFKFTVSFEKRLLDGEVTYVNISKGREHYAVMYISPKAIDKLTGGKQMTGASVDNVWVEVSKAGQILEKSSHRPGVVPNAQHLPGLVLNKDETPFAPLFYDRYESIKKSR